MTEYEFEGKTTEEAIQVASRELAIPEEDLSIDIIEPGSGGIFGLVGGKKAKIKVVIEADEEDEYTEDETDDGIQLAKDALENILARIPVEASVQAEPNDGKIILDIDGDKSGLLIGRKGKTLDALQFIVNKIVNKAMERKMHVVVDSENYRKRREESLTQLALKIGDKAKRIKKPVATNPLNPHDRRIIHLTLKEDDALDTKSRGDGLLKKVLVIPRDR
ncbi:MAG: Jag N-terminal domain-containing protein [Deltaproteobacteria bacterium]|nr:Jag N-terminal domain-containing protein [Deltaproteobacteria bacterium]